MGYKKTAFKMAPKSPMVKALTAKQEANLPAALKAEIAAAPGTPTKQTTDKKTIGPVKATDDSVQ